MENKPAETAVQNETVETAVQSEPAEDTAENASSETAAPARSGKKLLTLLLILIPVLMIVLPIAINYTAYSIAAFKAAEAFAAGDYAAAREFYASKASVSGNYEKALECSYLTARDLVSKGSYSEAHEIYLGLGTYKDSDDLANECLYLAAKDLMEKGSYSEARDAFLGLGRYEDCKDLATECLYLSAKKLAEEEDYAAAAEIFTQLSGYKDSALLASEYNMELVYNLYREGNFKSCMELAEKCIGGHEHAELYYNLARLGDLGNGMATLGYLRELYDAIEPYHYLNIDTQDAMKHPAFFLLRFADHEWETKDGDYLYFDSDEDMIYSELSWGAPEGEISHGTSEEGLHFICGNTYEHWFTITGFNEYYALSCGIMYVVDNENQHHMFYNLSHL